MKLPILAVALAVALTGCTVPSADPTPAVAPVTVSANALQGRTVKVPLDSMLYIKTGSLLGSSYSGTVDDPTIASFIKGVETGDVAYYPGLKPLKVGETSVTLSNSNGGIQHVVFTLDVTR